MRTAQSMAAARDTRQLLDDPSLHAHSPGEEFAQAASLDGGGDDFALSFRSYLPTAFPLFAERPRYTVRQLLNAATVRDRGKAVPYIEETRPNAVAHAASGTSYEATLEAAFGPGLAATDFTDLTVSLPVPDGLLAHPRLLAAFIDRRLLVRVGVRENQTLLHGSADGVVPGLLNLPGLRRVSTDHDLLGQLTEAAALVEETGGSCDGVVAHPSLYWKAVESGLLDRVATAGLRIARTRMMPRDHMLLADFRAAATLLDPQDSTLTLRRGAGRDGADLIEARCRLALAVHLPQHFVLVGPGTATA